MSFPCGPASLLGEALPTDTGTGAGAAVAPPSSTPAERDRRPARQAQLEVELAAATAADAALVFMNAVDTGGGAGVRHGQASAVSLAPPALARHAVPEERGGGAEADGRRRDGRTGRAGGGPALSIGAALGSLESGLRGASFAVERLYDDVTLAVSHGLTDNPLVAVLGQSPLANKVAEPVRVVVRLRPSRPPLGKRSARIGGAHGAVQVRGAARGAAPATFQFAALLEEPASQAAAYEHGAGTLVPRLLAGRCCAALFVGATGAGKTYAAFGSPNVLADFTRGDDEEWGAAPRASRQLFDTLGEAIGPAGPLELSVTWYEVRGSQLDDLLRATDLADDAAPHPHGGQSGAGPALATDAAASPPSLPPSHLRIRESPSSGPYIKGLCRLPVERHDQLLSLLSAGSRRRDAAVTLGNLRSSAKTSFFTLHLRPRSAPKRDPPPLGEPRLAIVDVAAAHFETRLGGSFPKHTTATGDAIGGSSGRSGASSRGSTARGARRSRTPGGGDASMAVAQPLLGPGQAALAECVELLLGAQARGESLTGLATTFRRHPVTRLLQPTLLGEYTTTATVCASPAEAELPSTLAALRLGALLRSATTNVPPSVPSLVPLKGRSAPYAPSATTVAALRSPWPPTPREGLGAPQSSATIQMSGHSANDVHPFPATPVHPPPSRVPQREALEAFAQQPVADNDGYGGYAFGGSGPYALPLASDAGTPLFARGDGATDAAAGETPLPASLEGWDGGIIGGGQAEFARSMNVDTAQIRALREHASALQRHIDAGHASAAAYHGVDTAFSADETWSSLYHLNPEPPARHPQQDSLPPSGAWGDYL